MPDPTTHFSIDVPTNQGDTGAWGSILLLAWDNIDKIVRGMAGKPSEQMLVSAVTGAGSEWLQGTDGVPRTTTSVTFPNGGGVFTLPLPHVRPGQRITGFTSRGMAINGATCAVKLCFLDLSGARTEVSAGHSLPAAEGNTTTSGLTHDVAPGRVYYIELTPFNSDTGDQSTIYWVQVATTLL